MEVLPAAITLIALLEYMVITYQVGANRAKYGITAPTTTGDENWERMFRVQQNTVEQLVVFIPSLWIFSHFWSPAVAAGVGLLFVIGRPIYYKSYVAEPSSRTVGFVLGFLANVVLVVGGLIGVVLAVF